MSIQSELAADDEEEQTEPQNQPPSHHPSAPSDEVTLFVFIHFENFTVITD